MGEYLKMEDEMMTTIRGGKRIELVKNLSHHVPVIPIGNLDDYGKELLDAMLEGMPLSWRLLSSSKTINLHQDSNLIRRLSKKHKKPKMKKEVKTVNPKKMKQINKK
eukprot:TRINITY_DN20998_c0_g1_i1.p1 TRINITY_DN20998_c0_g1~~TRINITY_DN20998_c0_g1_i1.p1  ORF type:complete len:107 (-),score=22.35 TRINITY_DN20998_c0_g1_i1:29-349(-)